MRLPGGRPDVSVPAPQPEDLAAVLRDMVDYHAPQMSSWRHRIEFGDDGGWWLTQDGRRRRSGAPWAPEDETDAFAVIAILYAMNGGDVPFPPAVLEKLSKGTLTEDRARTHYLVRGYSLLVRRLLFWR